MGVNVQKSKNINPAKKSMMGKIYAQFSKFIDWLAKGQAGNLPCAG